MKKIYSNIFKFNNKNISKASNFLKKGGLVGVPTETVYGVAANAYSNKSVKKIYKLKKRPRKNPLIIHYLNFKDLIKELYKICNDDYLDKALLKKSIQLIKNSQEMLV